MRRIGLIIGLLLTAGIQQLHAKGLDEQINDWFAPIADAWEGIVLFPIKFSETMSIPIVLIILIGGALFFTIYFGFVNIRRFGLAIKVVRGHYDELEGSDEPILTDTVRIEHGDLVDTIKIEGHQGEVSHFQALTAAVSGTVGLGNIAGVAVAIAIGGAGATFWMIVAGLLGMSSKFVECTLGVKYRDIDENGVVYGGPMYYLSKGFREMNMTGLGKVLAVVFAILCVGASFGGGNVFQSNQAVAQITQVVGADAGYVKTLFGAILAAIVAVVIIGGIKRIGSVTERVVPFMAGIYVLAALVVLIANYQYIDDAFALIISEAFSTTAVAGGAVGVLLVGFQRAAFSNEAGAGSAAIAHSAVNTKYPASEGVVALLEPFIDTVVICTMTALVIVFYNFGGMFEYGDVVSGEVLMTATGERIGGVNLTSNAFNSVIPGFSYVLSFAVVLFAISTMLSWSYYGLQSWKYLFGRSKASDLTFKILFLLFAVIGAAATLDAVVKFSDAMILALVFPNMIGLLFLFPRVKEEMTKYLNAIKTYTSDKKD